LLTNYRFDFLSQGDVSNKESKESKDANAKKKPEGLALRRSRRLSNEPAQDDANPAEDTAADTSRRQSLRSTTSVAKAKAKPAANPFAEPAPRAPATRKRVSKASEEEPDSKKPAGETKPRTKRSRPAPKEEPVSRKTIRRGSNNARSNGLSDSEEVPQQVPISTGKNLCQDILLDADHRLNRQPFSAREYIPGVAVYDAKNKDDVLQVPKYVTDIFQRLFNSEVSCSNVPQSVRSSIIIKLTLLAVCFLPLSQETTRPLPYMDKQPELNGMMRSILVDWLIEVHMKFRLLPETLYLCVNIIDRYLSLQTVLRNRLQLVGVTALLIACKYEEIYPPEVKDCVYITDRAYTRQDVLDMEAEVVKTLKFSLTVPTGHPFLQRFLHVTNASSIVRNLANYYMERMLQEHSALKYKPSLLAATAVCLANSNPDHFDHEGFTDEAEIPPKFVSYSFECCFCITPTCFWVPNRILLIVHVSFAAPSPSRILRILRGGDQRSRSSYGGENWRSGRISQKPRIGSRKAKVRGQSL
jgi:hypothetical protein